jgi:hypothetical protein
MNGFQALAQEMGDPGCGLSGGLSEAPYGENGLFCAKWSREPHRPYPDKCGKDR